VVVQSEALYGDVYGRLRDVVVGPDHAVYVSTSNSGLVNRILRIGR
jgi:glucose/arabinose dehydrogenase